MSNPKFILGACVGALLLGGILYLAYPTPEKYENSKGSENNPENNKSTIPEGAQMEDGTILE